MKSKIKILFLTLSILIIIGLIGLTAYLKSVHDYKEKVANMNITSINLENISDGTYIGECDVDFIYAKVSVTVQNNRIIDIQLLEHKNGKGQPAEIIINDIIQNQSLEVDVVSGATNSSKVIKKAIENAFTKN